MPEIYCIGDSITQGFWDVRGGWADRIKQYFHRKKLKDISTSVSLVFNWGISGDNAEDILKRLPILIAAREKDGKPREALYIIAVGVNDSLARDSSQNTIFTTEQYQENLEKIAEMIRPHSRRLLFVGLTPVIESKIGVNSPSAIYWNKRIEDFNDILVRFCQKNGHPYVEIFESMQKQEWEEWFPDGVHPNTEGHEWMFERIMPKMKELIK